jgi:hypothetical protein
MVTSTLIISLLSTVIGYGFPSGNGFEPGAIHVGLSPASAIPNITMSRDCVKSAVTARDPTWAPIDSTTVGLDQYFHLGRGSWNVSIPSLFRFSRPLSDNLQQWPQQLNFM